MLPFRRNSRLGNIINSDKHEVVWSALAEDASTTKTVTLIKGVPTADADSSIECEVGSKVFGIYIELNISAETTTEVKILHWNVRYVDTPGTQATSNPNTYYQDDRSRILKRGMEMLVRDQSTLTKRIFFVRIPRKMQRVTAGSFLIFEYVSTSANTQNLCGFAIYKEFK